MFSKALFKQSCKANGIMWAIITFAVCFMLACVMLISGGGNISGIKNSMQDTIIKSQINEHVKTTAINYYEYSYGAMEVFDKAFADNYKAAIAEGKTENEAITPSYAAATKQLLTYAQGLGSQAVAKKVEADSSFDVNGEQAKQLKNEIFAVIFFVLNPQGVDLSKVTIDEADISNFNISEIYDQHNEPTEYSYLPTTLIGADLDVENEDVVNYRSEQCQKSLSVFLAHSMTTDDAIAQMVEQLADYGVDEETYRTFDFADYAYMKKLSRSTVVSYSFRLEQELSELDQNASDYAEQVQNKKNDITGDLTAGFLSSLPENVSTALREVGSMDLYTLIVGSIFYKMAGLLLPFIYVIMISNSLIAGQVDNGSMAYILSGSVKRNQVTFTQALYLVLSVFAMTLFTTATSCVCLAIVHTESTTLTFGQLLLLNLGSFAVLFAVSGICFLASCWFNRSKNSMAIGGGLTMFFLVATMLGLFGSEVLPSIVRLDALNFFNYVSIVSLFDVVDITEGGLAYLWKFAILFAIGIVCFCLGSKKFSTKDLPL